MPNWCYNNVTVSYNKENESILREKLSEDKELFMQFVPRPPEYDEGERWYGWNCDNWGTKWDATPTEIEWDTDHDMVSFKLETAWGPPTQFYEALEKLGYEVEAYYLEEGMCFVGRYFDGEDESYQYANYDTIDEMEQNLPSWVDDEFNIIERMREEEMYKEEEEYNEFLYNLERTEWHPASVKPFHAGKYEVETKAWPWPHYRDFENGKWDDTFNKNKVVRWRGITLDAYLDALISKEF